MRSIVLGLALLAALVPGKLWAQASPDLSGTSLDDLMNIEVTSVSKKEQTLSRTGAAVFVISQDDIRRSGATNIPDLLRMAPGVDVAQIDANQWAISIRGFNTLYSNKVLVLIDGRTVYTDSFSGVFWDQVNVPLADIERIEVIRGPGGTVWGANAVNGVINIITKSSADTKGALIAGGGGTKETGEAMAQYGGDAGSDGAYRVYARYFNTGDGKLPGGLAANDGWHTWQAGYRSDWRPSSRDTFSVQGDFLGSGGGATSSFVFTDPLGEHVLNNSLTNNSGDVLARWVHTLANGSETSLQVYEAVMGRRETDVDISNDTLDVDFEHHLGVGSRQDIVYGLDYRVSRDGLRPLTGYSFRADPAVRMDNLFAAFVQDEIRLARRLFLTAGTKLDHNDYTGFDLEPSLQLVWTATDRTSFWASAGRAVRQPSHLEYGAQFNQAVVDVPGIGAALVSVVGNPHIQAEHVNDYEAGYRGQLSSRLSFDATGFLSYYDRLETYEPQTPVITMDGDAPMLTLPLMFGNLGHARDYGVEFFGRWNVNRRWEISTGFSLLQMKTGKAPSSGDTFLAGVPGSSPHSQPQIRSRLNLRSNVEWDGSAKYVSSLPDLHVPGYLRVDARLGWRLGQSSEISLIGQNLTSGRHIEFVDLSGLFLTTEVTRSIFTRIAWRF